MEKSYFVAVIEETLCIGCTKCIQACPVDAILGASQQLHAVLTEFCIGCQLCVPPCPVQCIEMIPLTMSSEQRRDQALVAKQQYNQKQQRLILQKQRKAHADLQATQQLEATLASALNRAHQKRQSFKKRGEHEGE